eukprot:scaffold482_cov247-Pinguiococcus_pyrenoidosus.AAC.23
MAAARKVGELLERLKSVPLLRELPKPPSASIYSAAELFAQHHLLLCSSLRNDDFRHPLRPPHQPSARRGVLRGGPKPRRRGQPERGHAAALGSFVRRGTGGL